MSFQDDIKAYAKKTNMRLGYVSSVLKLKLFSGVIMDTRVDTGRLRGNWQTSTGYPKFTPIERLDPTGSLAIEEVAANITDSGADYLTNNLPYAEVWEERDGMVAKNMARIQRALEEAVKSA